VDKEGGIIHKHFNPRQFRVETGRPRSLELLQRETKAIGGLEREKSHNGGGGQRRRSGNKKVEKESPNGAKGAPQTEELKRH